MNVTFYTFAKKDNSTKRPGGGAGYNVTLKEPSSVTAPVISLVWPGAGSPVNYNYAYIPAFARYYFIRNWNFADRQWTAELTVDVLASWKTYIGNSSKYVLRSAYKRDLEVIDTYYPAKGGENHFSVSESTKLVSGPENGGIYIISVTGVNNTLTIGGCGYYACTESQLETIIYNAFNQVASIVGNTGSISDVESAITWLGESVVKGTSNIAQFINSVVWVPHTVAHEAATVPVYLGLVNAGNAYPIKNAIVTDNFTIDLGSSGIDFSGPIWEWVSPLCTYTLEFMPFGLIPLDSLAIFNNGAIKCEYRFDIVSGVGILKVYAKEFQQETYYLLTIRSAQIGTQIQLGGIFVNYASALGTVASAVSNIAGAETIGETLIAGAAGIGSAISAISPDSMTVGHAGGIAAVDTTATLHIRQLDHVPEDKDEHGQPLCQIKQLSTIPGFILCQEGDIDAPAPIAELIQIKGYLEGGFFYE